MAHPRKHSRLITVNGLSFRWHVDLDYDSPDDEKCVSVFPADDPNGARLAMGVCLQTISPGLVRRLILAGTRLGYAPHDRTTSLVIPAAHASEILHDYPRLIYHQGVEYTWTPDSCGGLHLKVRRSDSPTGQLLATFATLRPQHLCELFVSKVIAAALSEGWRSEAPGLDCHWLGAAECQRIMAEMQKPSASEAAAPPLTFC